MIKVPITIEHKILNKQQPKPIRFSVPFANGKVFDCNRLELSSATSKVYPAHYKILAYWPNGSIKWLQGFSQINEQGRFLLTNKAEKNKETQADPSCNFVCTATKNAVIINNHGQSFSLNKKQLCLFKMDCAGQFPSQPDSIQLIDASGDILKAIIEEPIQTEANDFEIAVTCRGCFQGENNNSPVHFKAHYTFYNNCPQVNFKLTIHNTKSMKHKAGKWDLGNENAFNFKQLALHFRPQDPKAIDLLYHKDGPRVSMAKLFAQEKQTISLFQASSGGENWQSDNHVNAENTIPLHFRGFRLLTGNKVLDQGLRATPQLYFNDKHGQCRVLTRQFWQHFPKAISFDGKDIIYAIFPEQHHDGFELQPGEKSSFAVQFNFCKDAHSEPLAQPETQPLVQICPQYLASTLALSQFDFVDPKDPLQTIIAQGIDGPNSFFYKRECIDEYGWRNFGDLFADHEVSEYQGNDELVSHYNNQYDPLLGFLQQYLLNKNPKWLELASDLANHIKDIDIYDTVFDRGEYNQGLFWHTDHYVPAKTASHRTYSKLQPRNVYMDHIGAGGPGSNHCYTSGLALHYFLTGSQSSKNAVIKLTGWITHIFEGSGTFGEFLLALKNRHRPDTKNVLSQQYPLDRGTGNYINALLDAFEVTNQQSYLDKASLVLKHTLHKSDVIDEQKFRDVENSWFYTIVLQSAYKYLLIKEKNKQLDSSFQSILLAFLHYSDWMAVNEQPYLLTPEILEYPNITWAAQDIRKANILYMAAYYANNTEQQTLYRNKATDFYHYVINFISDHKQASQTRVLTILMQNCLIKPFVEQHIDQHQLQCSASLKLSDTINSESLLKRLVSTITSTNIQKEIDWLCRMSPKINSLIMNAGLKR